MFTPSWIFGSGVLEWELDGTGSGYRQWRALLLAVLDIQMILNRVNSELVYHQRKG
jgi:hypothetical protein